MDGRVQGISCVWGRFVVVLVVFVVVSALFVSGVGLCCRVLNFSQLTFFLPALTRTHTVGFRVMRANVATERSGQLFQVKNDQVAPPI